MGDSRDGFTCNEDGTSFGSKPKVEVDLYAQVHNKATEVKRRNQKPKYVIVDVNTYYNEMVHDSEHFIPSCATKLMDGDRYIGLKVAVMLNTNLVVIKVR